MIIDAETQSTIDALRKCDIAPMVRPQEKDLVFKPLIVLKTTPHTASTAADTNVPNSNVNSFMDSSSQPFQIPDLDLPSLTPANLTSILSTHRQFFEERAGQIVDQMLDPAPASSIPVVSAPVK